MNHADTGYYDELFCHGSRYYCIKTEISKNNEIYAVAEKVVVSDSGNLVLLNSKGFINLAIPSGKWSAIYEASCLDGAARAVAHWKGEVES